MSGDRTRFVDLERFDLGDALSLQDLIYAYLDNVIGNLLGYGGGCLSAPKITLSSAGGHYYAGYGAFAFYHSDRVLTDDNGTTYKGWEGRILLHDPAKSGNVPAASKVDYTSAKGAAEAAFGGAGLDPFNTAGAYPFVWARPILVNADADARRQWNTGAGQEQPVTVETRQRVRVEFSLGKNNTTAPDPDGGAAWVAVGKFVDWQGGPGTLTPTIQALSPWDNPELWTATNEAGNWFDDGWNSNLGARRNVSMGMFLDSLTSGGAIPDGGFTPGADRSIGLIPMLHLIRKVVLLLHANGNDFNWFRPQSNVQSAQENALVALIEIADLQNAMAKLDEAPKPWAAGQIYWDGASYALSAAEAGHNGHALHIGAVNMLGAGQIDVLIADPPTGYNIVSAIASPQESSGIDVGMVVKVTNGPLDAGGTPWKVTVKVFRANSGNATNASFYLTVFISKNV